MDYHGFSWILTDYPISICVCFPHPFTVRKPPYLYKYYISNRTVHQPSIFRYLSIALWPFNIAIEHPVIVDLPKLKMVIFQFATVVYQRVPSMTVTLNQPATNWDIIPFS